MTNKGRVLIAKPGLDGHDRGAKVVVQALKDIGFEVIYSGLHQSIEAISEAALQEDVELIGLSILSGAHLPLTRKLMHSLKSKGIPDVRVFVGGNIPEMDIQPLMELGVEGVFNTGTPIRTITEAMGKRVTKVEVEEEPSVPEEEKLEIQEFKELEKVTLESGIEVKPIYDPSDIDAVDYEKDIGPPGKFPFTRGIFPSMYRKRPFTMRQYSGFGTAKQTNERFKYLLRHGQNALNVAFDLPTQLGLASDDPMAEGEVGRVGMHIDTLRDMEEAFEGIPLDKVSASLTINSVASVLLAMYIAVAEKQGIPLKELRGNIQNDILKEYIGRGAWIFATKPSIRLIGDTIEYCAKNMPRYNPVSVCGYHIREAGANPVQEIAYAFEIAKTYINEGQSRGLDIDQVAQMLSFNFDIHGNFFEQIAKFRAARRLWAKIVKDLGAVNPRSMWLRALFGGGGGGLTIEQPENNIVRGAYYALISALSGTNTMALCSYDEAYTIPTEKAALISLRTMQILTDEMGLRDTADPLAGSYYVETLTNQMEEKFVECMKEIKDQGGMIKAVESGYVHRQVAKQAYIHEKKILSGEIIKVGVNKYRIEEEKRDVKLHEYDPQIAEEQIQRMQKVMSERDNEKVIHCLNLVREKAKTSENLMPCLIDAVKALATVGEITKVFKEVFGKFEEPVRL